MPRNILRKLSVTLAVALIALCIPSCTEDISESERTLLDEYSNMGNQADYSNSALYTDIGSAWLSPEREYISDGTDDSKGIVDISVTNFVHTDNRIYYPVKNYYKNSINHESSYSYVSLSTGKCASLCPDPLCNHLDGSGCKYLDLSMLMTSPDSDELLYAAKRDNSDGTLSICRIDVQKDVIEKIYTEKTTFLLPRFIADGKLYFNTIYYERVENENKEITKQTIEKLKVLDLETREVKTLDNKYENQEYGEYFFTDGNYIYFNDFAHRRIFVTDMNFENERTIFEYDSKHSVSDFMYDTNTRELYFLCSSGYAVIDDAVSGKSDEVVDGAIYRVDENFNCERLPMERSNILSYIMTNNYIYYTVFDPIIYGETPRGGNLCCENGNKIYRVKRDDLTSEELVFDGRDELFFESFYPIDNHLYVSYLKLMDEGGMQWFRVMGITARIDIGRDTIKWLMLDEVG